MLRWWEQPPLAISVHQTLNYTAYEGTSGLYCAELSHPLRQMAVVCGVSGAPFLVGGTASSLRRVSLTVGFMNRGTRPPLEELRQ